MVCLCGDNLFDFLAFGGFKLFEFCVFGPVDAC